MASKKDPNLDFLFKVVVIGDSNVGKTALSVRFTKKEFPANLLSTIGIDMAQKLVMVGEARCGLHIWDTAGHERFRSIAATYYREAQGVLFVYDITNNASFVNIKRWLLDVERNATGPVVKILVGNKSDASPRNVDYDVAKAYADSLGINFFETSALTGLNVDEVFQKLAVEMHAMSSSSQAQKQKTEETVAVNIATTEPEPESRGCC